MLDQLVRSTVRPPSVNGAIRLISSADRTRRAGFETTLLTKSSHRCDGVPEIKRARRGSA